MSIKEASERLKNKFQEMRKEARSVFEIFGDAVPRPILERKTIILRKPLLKMFKERREER